MDNIEIKNYSIDLEFELVSLWRESFEYGVGIKDWHPIADQINFFRNHILPCNQVKVVFENDIMLGFIAFTETEIAALYIDPKRLNMGIGTQLLEIAKQNSNGQLSLYTFSQNKIANRFYIKNGFKEIKRGFEPAWKLEDVLYKWEK